MERWGLLIIVVGLAFEARIAAGPGIHVVCGGDGRHLTATLTAAIAEARTLFGDCPGIISFGVAGGLAPQLRPGTCVIGSAILAGSSRLLTNQIWSQKLLQSFPDAVSGMILGASAPVGDPRDKRALHVNTGAIAVDMESHVVHKRRRFASEPGRRHHAPARARASELTTAAGYGMTRSMSMEGVREPVSAQRVAAPAMTNATVGKSVEPTASMESAASTVKSGKSMEPTTSAVKPTTTTPAVKATALAVKATATTPMPAASTPTAMPGDCRDVRHDAKRAHRNACRQNAYSFPLHGAFLNAI
jgi:hypothetical protein